MNMEGDGPLVVVGRDGVVRKVGGGGEVGI